MSGHLSPIQLDSYSRCANWYAKPSARRLLTAFSARAKG